MTDDITKDSLQIARLEERMATMNRDMEALTRQVSEMNGQINVVLDTLAQARGGWRTLMWLAGASSAAGAIVTWALINLQFKQ